VAIVALICLATVDAAGMVAHTATMLAGGAKKSVIVKRKTKRKIL